jgi:hypothetical protein
MKAGEDYASLSRKSQKEERSGAGELQQRSEKRRPARDRIGQRGGFTFVSECHELGFHSGIQVVIGLFCFAPIWFWLFRGRWFWFCGWSQ